MGALREKIVLEIMIELSFREKFPDVVDAIRNCCAGQEGVGWKIVPAFKDIKGEGKNKDNTKGKGKGPNMKSLRLHITDLPSLWEWVQSNRQMSNVSRSAAVFSDGVGFG